MGKRIKNLLYRNPKFYEILYPEDDEKNPAMCERIFERFLSKTPESILDIGCGTGRDLRSLSKWCSNCVGIDYLPQMIKYAKSQGKGIQFLVEDMRNVRLCRAFDAVLCLGSTLMYAFTNADVDRTLNTFVAHSHPETLLILDMHNCSALFGRGYRKEIMKYIYSEPLIGKYITVEGFDRRKQMLIRHRTWYLKEKEPIQDHFEYRMFFPQEIEHLLNEKGYRVVGMYDNRELEDSDLSGNILYIVAKYKVD